MSIPPLVLLARLEHELEAARLATVAIQTRDSAVDTRNEFDSHELSGTLGEMIERAQQLAAQMREAL